MPVMVVMVVMPVMVVMVVMPVMVVTLVIQNSKPNYSLRQANFEF